MLQLGMILGLALIMGAMASTREQRAAARLRYIKPLERVCSVPLVIALGVWAVIIWQAATRH